MSLKLRLARAGAKKRPFYRIVVADARSPRDGRFIEVVGTWNPILPKGDEKRVTLNVERIKHWQSVGAQPTDRVLRFLDAAGLAKRDAAQQPGEGQARQEGAGAPRRRRREGSQGRRGPGRGCAAAGRAAARPTTGRSSQIRLPGLRLRLARDDVGTRSTGPLRIASSSPGSGPRTASRARCGSRPTPPTPRASPPMARSRRRTAGPSRSPRSGPPRGPRRTCWWSSSRASPTGTRRRRSTASNCPSPRDRLPPAEEDEYLPRRPDRPRSRDAATAPARHGDRRPQLRRRRSPRNRPEARRDAARSLHPRRRAGRRSRPAGRVIVDPPDGACFAGEEPGMA